MKTVKLYIPVKPYVRKYIESQYPTPLKLTTTTPIGALIYICLEKNSSPWYKKSVNLHQKRYDLLNDKLTVLLPANDNTFYRTGYSVPEAKSLLINDFFEDKIIRHLHMRCELYATIGRSRNKAIDDFCAQNNIDIDRDITHAALKKAEYRFRMKKENN